MSQNGSGDFDLYCDICGLPFDQIEQHDWMYSAKLLYKNHAYNMEAQSYGRFDISKATPLSNELINILKQTDDIEVSNNGTTTASLGLFLHNHNKDAKCIHEDCFNRKDMDKVSKDKQYVKEYQQQHFDTDEFLENEELQYLLKKPTARSKPKTKSKDVEPKPKTKNVEPKPKAQVVKPLEPETKHIEKLSVKELTDACNIFNVKKGKNKAETIAIIRKFVCNT
jgi:hypothetical protein